MSAKRRIALYGGTFDPVHLGHVEVARRVLQLFEIEKVLFVPAQVAPHKIGRVVAAPLHRYAMLALATQSDPNLVVSSFELDEPNRRYTVDTIAHFEEQLGVDTELFFIMGADSWSEITTWRDWQRLLVTVNHIVVTRPGYQIERGHVGSEIATRIVDLRASGAAFDSVTERRIYFTDAVMKDVAATDIRRVARERRFEELARLVPAGVAEYIVKYGIYQGSNETQYS
ncbi:MAG: nicotinate (nicotinamide) nucleotide adenylyltransferase [Blastocatellia bacterium]|nr:MAG: nicotinate (nicotinamide) nucleotide adenylyltransferase [Blastocatellia bacterium]